MSSNIQILRNDGTVNPLKTQEDCNDALKNLNDSKMERIKAVAFAAIALGTTIALAFIGLEVASFAGLLVSGSLASLAEATLLPQLFSDIFGPMLTIGSGLGAGIAFTFYSVQYVWNQVWNSAVEHWKEADTLSHKENFIHLKRAELKGANES